MKIAFCLGSLNKGGAERVVCNLANFFAAEENEVYIIITKECPPSYKLDKRITIITLDGQNKKKGFRNLRRVLSLSSILKRHQFDIVLGFLQEPIARLLFVKTFSIRNRNIPLIVSVRIDPKTAFNTAKRRASLLLYGNADGYVFQTEEIKSFFNKKIQENSVVIANSVDPSFYLDNGPRSRKNIIVSVGRLTEQKNYPMLLKAFQIFKSTHPDYGLEIYGEGPLQSKLDNMIDSLDIRKAVKLCGNSNNIKERIQDASMFVIASDYEGVSNALMEAMALGVPSISTNSAGGGAAMLINDNKNGFLIPTGDIDELSRKMSIIADDKRLANKLSVEAKKSMEKYRPEIVNLKWKKYVEDVITRRRK